MTAPNPASGFARMLVLGSLLAIGLAGTAAAQTCPPTPPLVSGVPAGITSDPYSCTITNSGVRWSAVGVRAADANNWNLEALESGVPFPVCLTGTLASSAAATGIDFAVTDWRVRPAQSDYVRISTGTAAGTSARIEFEQAAYEYQANRPFDQVFIGTSDVLTVRETNMQAGVRYFIEISPSAGMTGLKCYLFAPATGGSGWALRADRVLEQALVGGGDNLVQYTPTATGQFGIVITNEDGVAGNFYITVKHCPFSASPLADNTPRYISSLDDWPGFTPPARTWGVIGVRGEPGYSYNWDAAPGFRLQNGPFMTCSDSILASQSSGLGTRVIVGDFRSNPLRFYTAHASLEGQPKSNSEGYMEWEDGQDSIVFNALPLAVSPPDHNVFDAWTLRLVHGTAYNFQLTPNGGATANYRMLLFTNPAPGTSYWATRPEAQFDVPSLTVYSPPATGLYGFVVVNDNGGSGGYTVAVASGVVGIEPRSSGVGASRIRAVQPNPSIAGARIEYELARAGQATVRVTDVVGRTVVDLAASSRAAGAGSVEWSGRASTGSRPAAGVYFATLYLDGAVQDRMKLIVLR